MTMPFYAITNHVVARFKERFPAQASKFKEENDLRRHIIQIVNEAEENRQILNSQVVMSKFYEKYGYDTRFKFLNYDNCVFVAVEKHKETRTEYVIVTVYTPHNKQPHLKKNVSLNKKV